jgi:gas vesicle protein
MCDNNKTAGIKGTFIGFVIGFIAGGVTALLLTAKTGEELRSDIKRISKEVVDKVKEETDNVKNLTKEKYDSIVNNVISSYKKLKDLTEKEIEFIKKVIDEQKNIAK